MPADPNLPQPSSPDPIDAGIVIDFLGGNCPVQGEGEIDGHPFYFRARGSHWSLTVDEKDSTGSPAWEHKERYGSGPFDAGWMPESDAKDLIAKGAALFRKRAL